MLRNIRRPISAAQLEDKTLTVHLETDHRLQLPSAQFEADTFKGTYTSCTRYKSRKSKVAVFEHFEPEYMSRRFHYDYWNYWCTVTNDPSFEPRSILFLFVVCLLFLVTKYTQLH